MNVKKAVKGLAVLAALFAAGGGLFLYANQVNDADQKAFDAMKTAYQTSMQTGNPAGFAAHLANDFRGTTQTGQEVTRAQYATYVSAMARALNMDGHDKAAARATYRVNVIGTTVYDRADKTGGSAISFGTTKETLTTASGEKNFVSTWYAKSRKDAGTWKIYDAGISADPVGDVFGNPRERAGRATRDGLRDFAAQAVRTYEAEQKSK